MEGAWQCSAQPAWEMAQRAGADSSCSLGTVAPRRQRGGKLPARSWEGGFKKKSDRELEIEENRQADNRNMQRVYITG